MDPITNNQMNSMYQAPLGQQPVHRTSIVSIIILLLIAIIVAVLGFGRINSMKEEQTKMMQKEAEQARMIQMEAQATAAAKADEASILTDLENISVDSNAEEIADIEAAF
jgi:Tfp pilus assembly protein PilO